jgi:hypothetical protein
VARYAGENQSGFEIGNHQLNNKFSALKELGVGEFAHLNGKLESHLLGTYDLLRGWRNPEYVCDAGLYHAVYGTQPLNKLGIPHKEYSPYDRPRIREIIGNESERLVYLYGACDRDYLYPQIGGPKAVYRDRFTGGILELSRNTLGELLEITLANELEICISGPSFKEKHREGFIGLFDRFVGLVSADANDSYREVFKT